MKAKTMEISFTNDFIATDRFEKLYEEELREEPEDREDIIRHGLVVKMFLDDVLIGECFGITPYEYAFVLDNGQGFYDEEDAITDVDMSDHESVYVWSTTILPAFRGMGYGKQLRTEFARYASEIGYAKLLGHATSQSMVHIIQDLGGIFHLKGIHEEWFGTKRAAHFYTQFLTQNKDYNCGPFALAYLLETKGHTFSIEYLEKRLHTTNEMGTSPRDIEAFLVAEDMHYMRTKKLAPNSMIDITVENDGHWVVIMEQDPSTNDWWGYDPNQGCVKFQERYLLKNWHSPRYGIHKGFTLL